MMIEVAAEANPLTEALLYHVLRSASSSDPQQIQTGTKQLQNWETTPGYYPLLQTVFMDKSLPLEVRYLAIIQLKNGIDKYWRKTAPNAARKEDKAQIRARLIDCGINEADQRLALQNALVTAKIVRFEPDVMTQLISRLRAAAEPTVYHLHLSRALLILLHIIKELSTGKLTRTRASLLSASPELFRVLGRIYLDKTARWQSFFQPPDGSTSSAHDDEGGALDALDQSLLALKVLRRLLVAGYDFPNRDADVRDFWGVLRAQLGTLLPVATEDAAASPLATAARDAIGRHCVQLAKLYVDMARAHPAAFVLLPDYFGLVHAFWDVVTRFGEGFGTKTAEMGRIGDDGDVDEEEAGIVEKLAHRGLLLIRACVKMVFNPTLTFRMRFQEEREEKAKSVEMVKTQLLEESFVKEMMEVIVMRYFVFTPRDLRQWLEEPDEWEKREDLDGEGFDFAIRPCAEKLFLDLAINFKDLIIQPLLNVFYSIASLDNDNILFKDSVYTAVGLAAPVLHPHLDFDAFISATLVPEVQRQQPGYNILRRRIAILLAQWISVKVSDQSRPLVYQIFRHLLDKSDALNDQVVRVTAGRQFKNVADDWEFKPDQFMPYASDIFTRIMSLVEEVELAETKMALLNTISIMVERMEHRVTPYADGVVALLPPLWAQSGPEHLMKQAILTLLTRLITAMKADSRRLHTLMLPIIRGATEPGSDSALYLLDDALDLWAAIVAQTPAGSPTLPDLLDLTPHLLHALTLGSDALRMALQIAESYLLLAPQPLLGSPFRPRLLEALAALLGQANLSVEATGYVTSVLEVAVRAAAGLGGEEALRVLVADMVATGVVGRLVAGLRDAWEAGQTTGPNRRESSVRGMRESDYWCVLARLGVASPRLLVEAVRGCGMVAPEVVEGQRALKWLLDEWIGHCDNVGSPARRKLMVLALTRLLETGEAWILMELQALMTLWTDVIVELTDGNEDKSVDSLVYPRPEMQSDPDAPEAPEDARRRDLLYADEVHSVNLITFVWERVQAAVEAAGGQARFEEEWLVNVDRTVVREFGNLWDSVGVQR
ncbi:armadillo-type protein [Lineolata rhizophorae]|uniref:Armadillo-type protein n=1 Tax=Lineolata rhizophorae TaxID=578093 RepID=A0A6A6P3R5_9PEZI|nr:armadillo-type protein [Lineolata rhizophorae]